MTEASWWFLAFLMQNDQKVLKITNLTTLPRAENLINAGQPRYGWSLFASTFSLYTPFLHTQLFHQVNFSENHKINYCATTNQVWYGLNSADHYEIPEGSCLHFIWSALGQKWSRTSIGHSFCPLSVCPGLVKIRYSSSVRHGVRGLGIFER